MYQAIQLEAQMVHLELTEVQASYVGEILDMWIEGHEEATNDVITDRSIDSPEELLMAVDGMHEQFKAASEIRELLSAYAN
jgi:hypothetical protein